MPNATANHRAELEVQRAELEQELSRQLVGRTIKDIRIERFSHPKFIVQVQLILDDETVINVPHDSAYGFSAIEVIESE